MIAPVEKRNPEKKEYAMPNAARSDTYTMPNNPTKLDRLAVKVQMAECYFLSIIRNDASTGEEVRSAETKLIEASDLFQLEYNQTKGVQV